MDTLVVIIVIFLSLGAIQGLVFGLILFTMDGFNKTANRLLATLLLLLSYRLMMQILRLFGIGYYDSWYYFMLDLSWVHGALIYFYVMAQTNPVFKIDKATMWHFIPLVIQIVVSIFVRVQNLFWDGTKDSLSWFGYWGYWIWMNQPTVYIVASGLIVFYTFKAEKILQKVLSKNRAQTDRLNWLKRIVATFKFYFIAVLSILLGDVVFFNVTTGDAYFYFIRFYYYPFFIGISLLTYWIGLEGFNRRKMQKIKPKAALGTKKHKQLRQIAEALDELMNNDRIYLDPELNLRKTAQHMNVKSYLVTQCLSEILNTKFNDYLNGFRVEEVKRLLSQPEKKKLNLLTLAFQAGFNSKSSFNRSVKNHLGVHPKDLR